ncbi:hypothetical protein EVAR_96519_1 [Eumeta japonica]|uniref:Uncharacterized protein n=1 Tax=Eumeta variegata TaxID=151549 RepID=A0A4C1WFD1_EUMVA|nr:hypothetical protein EVAR_96519_1 [Eumeta japonica]
MRYPMEKECADEWGTEEIKGKSGDGGEVGHRKSHSPDHRRQRKPLLHPCGTSPGTGKTSKKRSPSDKLWARRDTSKQEKKNRYKSYKSIDRLCTAPADGG